MKACYEGRALEVKILLVLFAALLLTFGASKGVFREWTNQGFLSIFCIFVALLVLVVFFPHDGVLNEYPHIFFDNIIIDAMIQH